MSKRTFVIIGAAFGGILVLCVALSFVPIRVLAAGTGEVEAGKWAFITPRAVGVVRAIPVAGSDGEGPVRVEAGQALVYLVDDVEKHELTKAQSVVEELEAQEAMFVVLLDGMVKVARKALEKARVDLEAAKAQLDELAKADGAAASHALQRLRGRVAQQRLTAKLAERRVRELRLIASAGLPQSLGDDLSKELSEVGAKLDRLSGLVSSYRLSDAAERLRQQDSVVRELEAELEQARDLLSRGFASEAETGRIALNLERARSGRTVRLNAWTSLVKGMATEELDAAEAHLAEALGDLKVREGELETEERALERLQLLRAQAGLIGSELALAKAEMDALPQQGTESPEGQKLSIPLVKRNIDSTRAALNRARADLELAKIRLADRTVRAPISGLLVALDAFVGQTLVPDAHRAIGRIIDDSSELLFVVRVPQHRAPMIEKAQEAEVYLEAYPYRKYGTFAATVKEAALTPPGDTEEPLWEVALVMEKPGLPVVMGYKGYAEICVDRLSVVSFLLGRSMVREKGE